MVKKVYCTVCIMPSKRTTLGGYYRLKGFIQLGRFGSDICLFVVVLVTRRCSSCIALSSEWSVRVPRILCPIRKGCVGGTLFHCVLGRRTSQEGGHRQRIVGSYAEITPLSRFVCCLESEILPISFFGVSP